MASPHLGTMVWKVLLPLPTVWKILVALALVLPMGAFVAGSLVASAADEPRERDTIIIEQTGSSSSPSAAGSPSPSESGTPSPSPLGDDDDDDDDGEIETLTPSPDDVEDDDDSDQGRRRDSDDPDDIAWLRRRPVLTMTRRRRRTTTAVTAVAAVAAVVAAMTTTMTTTTAGRAGRAAGPTTTATTVTTTTTTEPTRPEIALPHRSGVSVRTRIAATVALLVAFALTGAGAIVYLIETQRAEEQVADGVDQEFDELATFQQSDAATTNRP